MGRGEERAGKEIGGQAVPLLFGAAYSVYARIVRLALEEKGVAYRLVEVDVFAAEGPPQGYLARHPFGRIPAFEHEGFGSTKLERLRGMWMRGFRGRRCRPVHARARARMNQAISVLDSMPIAHWFGICSSSGCGLAANGRSPDEARITGAVPRARVCLRALADIMGDQPWLAGDAVSLADLHAAPMLIYLRMAEPEGRMLLSAFPTLERWLDVVMRRASVRATRSPLEDEASRGAVDAALRLWSGQSVDSRFSRE